jgi:CDP-4-dehydro-6-deoxyglucose reductase, E1
VKSKKSKIRVPYALSVHDSEEVKAVSRVVSEHRTSLGRETKQFESKVAKLFGKKYGVMVNSGSSANLLAIELLNLPKGSEIITPLLTFATTVAPIVQMGLTPVFVDVERGTYLANLDQVESAITKKTRALKIPSLIGNVPDMERLRKIAKKHKLILIEDSCDTLGAKYKGKPTGTFSDISTTSFYGSHVINGAGGGGMILVNNPEWRDRLLVLRGWGRESSLMGESKSSENLEKRFEAKLGGILYDAKFLFTAIGYNFLPMEVSSAFALVQLGRLSGAIAKRRNNFNRLKNFFAKYDHFVLPEEAKNVRTAWLAFPLTIRNDAPFTRRDICTFLEKNNIQTRPVFAGNILRQPAFSKVRHRKSVTNFPETEHVTSHGFLVGCHQGLTNKQLSYMEQKFEEFLILKS